MIIGIFCGSASGNTPDYLNKAKEAGRLLAQNGIDIVYGGGKVGMMGAIADAALSAGGRVIGIIPRALAEKEIAHTGLTELYVVETMHERKNKMAELSHAFIALPGGAGTLDEIFEQWTWAQLGIHEKPCGFLNINQYFEPLQTMTEKMVHEGFLHSRHADMLRFSDHIEELLTYFKAYQPPERKWSAK